VLAYLTRQTQIGLTMATGAEDVGGGILWVLGLGFLERMLYLSFETQIGFVFSATSRDVARKAAEDGPDKQANTQEIKRYRNKGEDGVDLSQYAQKSTQKQTDQF